MGLLAQDVFQPEAELGETGLGGKKSLHPGVPQCEDLGRGEGRCLAQLAEQIAG